VADVLQYIVHNTAVYCSPRFVYYHTGQWRMYFVYYHTGQWRMYYNILFTIQLFTVVLDLCITILVSGGCTLYLLISVSLTIFNISYNIAYNILFTIQLFTVVLDLCITILVSGGCT
jgi:hypothetical protein